MANLETNYYVFQSNNLFNKSMLINIKTQAKGSRWLDLEPSSHDQGSGSDNKRDSLGCQ